MTVRSWPEIKQRVAWLEERLSDLECDDGWETEETRNHLEGELFGIRWVLGEVDAVPVDLLQANDQV